MIHGGLVPIEMVKRYSVIGPIIRTLDHDTLASNDIGSYLLSRRDHDKAVAKLADLGPLEAVTKTLQRSSLTLSATRRLFDKIVENEMKNRLGSTAPIINYASLETGIVKLQRGEVLCAAERRACITFHLPGGATATDDGKDTQHSFVKEAFKRRRVQRRALYIDVGFIPPTSNECERFFSAAKLQLTDLRKSMDIETIEMVMMLSYNRELWDVYSVESIRTNGRP